MENNNLEMNLYDLNKQLVSQLPEFTDAKSRVEDFKKDNVGFYMLLCRELNYFTLFQITSDAPKEDNFADVVVECANTIGVIKSAMENDDGAFEIWVTNAENESFVMYLFNYDGGVVPCHI